MSKEVSYNFSLGANLSPTFRAAITGANNRLSGLSAHIQKLESSNINKLGSSFMAQKEQVSILSKELYDARIKLNSLQKQSKGAGKDTEIFSLQVKQAEQKVQSLQYALDKNIQGYKNTIAQIKNAHGSVHSLSQEYALLSQNIEKAHARQNKIQAIKAQIEKDHASQIEKAQAMQNKIQTIKTQKENLRANRGQIQGEIVQTALPMMALSVPIKQAVSFEAAMADVAKTMDGMRDDDGNLTEQYYAMEQAVKNMARTIPMAHEELAGLFAAAGQQGLTDLGEIQEFVGMSAQMAVAFGMNQEEAADAIGGYRAALGLSFKDTRTMLDLMNQYANTTSATEKDIAEVVKRIGSLGQQAGVTVKPMTALSATLVSMKIPPEIAATGLKNFLLTMTSGRAATKAQTEEFKRLGFNTIEMAEAMQKDAPTAIINLLKTIKKLPKAEQVSSLSTLFGKESIGAIAPLLGQLDLVSKNLGISADETQYAGAMQKEFEARIKTTQANAQLFSNKIKEASVNLGSALLPALNDTMNTISPFISRFAEFASKNRDLIKYTLGTAGAMLACKMAFLVTRYAVNGLVTTYKIAQGAKLAFVAVTNRETYSLIAQKVAMLAGVTAIKAVTAVQWLLNAAMSANPIGIIIRGVSLLVGGMYALYQTCEPVQKAFDAVFSAIGSSLQWLWDKFILLYKKGRAVLEFLGLVDEEKEEVDFSMPTAQNAAQNMANSAEQKQNTKIQLDESSFGFAMQYAYMAEQEKTENKKAVPTASNIISENNKVSPTQYAVPDYDSFSETTAVTNAITNENYTSQKNYPKEQTAITIPMHFDIKAIDQAEFSKGMEKERPRIEKIVREVLEKCKHQEARVSFAN